MKSRRRRPPQVVRCAGPLVTVTISLLTLLFGGSGLFYLVAGATRWSTHAFLVGVGLVSLALATAMWRSFLVVGFGRLLRNPSFGLSIKANQVQRVCVDRDAIGVLVNGKLHHVVLVKGTSMDPVDRAHCVARAIQQAAGRTDKFEIDFGGHHDVAG